jgi:hypothetical protein
MKWPKSSTPTASTFVKLEQTAAQNLAQIAVALAVLDRANTSAKRKGQPLFRFLLQFLLRGPYRYLREVPLFIV